MPDWPARFEQFVERRVREAERAVLPPYTTDCGRGDHDMLGVGNAWSERLFDGPFYHSPPSTPRRAACSLVFVQSRDANTGARNPSALGAGETDKHLIYEGLSRVAADAVLAGAETIRGGGIIFSVWHPELVRLRESLGKPRHPVQIVATLRGLDLDRELLFNVPDVQVVVLTVGACVRLMQDSLAVRPWVTPIVLREPGELPLAFERFRALGIDRVSAVGGRNIATQLIDAGLVQDVYLTTAPGPGGEPDTPMYPRPLPSRVVLRKLGTREESGVTFEHVRLEG